MKKINLGCGNNVLKGYENYDKNPANIGVKYIDLNKPLPFNDDSIDVILLSQCLEHLDINPLDFMNEVYRVLRLGGMIKIGLPVYSPFIYHVSHNHPKGFFNPICNSSVSESYCKGVFDLVSVKYQFLTVRGFLYRVIDTIRKYLYQSVEFELRKTEK